jgi:hypothetical protein
MVNKVTTYVLVFVVILLSFKVFSDRSEFNSFKSQISRFEKGELEYQQIIDKNGDKIIEQGQVILTQKDAIEQGLLKVEKLKRVNSQTRVVTEVVLDTIVITHVDTMLKFVDGDSYLRLPQNYRFNDEFMSLEAKIDEVGLSLDNISIQNENIITIGYKRYGLFKPLTPIIEVKNTNPYIVTQSVSNVVIEKKVDIFHDKKTWGMAGFVLGVLIK